MKTRIQLDFSDDRVAEIDRLRELTGMATRKQFIEQALLLYEWALGERSQGRAIGSIDPRRDGYREVMLPKISRKAYEDKDRKDVDEVA